MYAYSHEEIYLNDMVTRQKQYMIATVWNFWGENQKFRGFFFLKEITCMMRYLSRAST